jgi:hypothetical protein
MKKSIVIIILLVILVGSWIAYRMYNKPHRDPSAESSIQITAVDLFRSYETNEVEANGRYLDKVLEVSGKITEITTNQESIPVIVLETENPMFTVRCTMENPEIEASVGDVVKIKGICTGYLSDVIIVKGTLVE